MSGGTVFKRILVALDGSENSFAACRVAAALAFKLGAEIRLLTVLPGTSIYTAPLAGEISHQQNIAGMGVLNKAVAIVEDENVASVTKRVVQASGSLVGAIVEDALESKSELVVLGTRGLGGFRRLALGSVSSGVAAHASCPVLVVRGVSGEGETQIRRLLVAVDGSQKATEAVSVAARLARAIGGELTVLHVVHVPSSAYGVGTEGVIDRIEAEARSAGRRFVSEAAASARALGVDRVKEALIENMQSPPKEITAYAKKNEIDLIAVGTRGFGDFRRLLLGSVASGVLSYAGCSVMVVR